MGTNPYEPDMGARKIIAVTKDPCGQYHRAEARKQGDVPSSKNCAHFANERDVLILLSGSDEKKY